MHLQMYRIMIGCHESMACNTTRNWLRGKTCLLPWIHLSIMKWTPIRSHAVRHLILALFSFVSILRLKRSETYERRSCRYVHCFIPSDTGNSPVYGKIFERVMHITMHVEALQNSEANASELLENLEEMFHHYL